MAKDTLLVPTNFTEVDEVAFSHALELAEAIPAKVVLLHILNKEETREEIETEFKEIIELVAEDTDVEVGYVIKEGVLYDEIAAVADEVEAHMIVMGTHGLQGWQFLTGSRALKIITQSHIPFIVVQERGPRVGGFDHIVLPIDFTNEEKQKLHYVASLAKYFDGEVHIVTPDYEDEFLSNKVSRNLHYAKNFLDEQEVSYDTEMLDEKQFDKATVRYAAKIDADLICILNHEDAVSQLFGTSVEQQIITNVAQIPVMVINQKIITKARGVIGT